MMLVGDNNNSYRILQAGNEYMAAFSATWQAEPLQAVYENRSYGNINI